MLRIFKDRSFVLRGWLAAPFNQGLLFLLGLAVFLIYPVFLPNLVDLGPFDEMSLITSGRELAKGNLPGFAYNPLIALLYGLAYLPVQADPFWILQIATIGRIVLFGLLWWSCYALARSLRHWVHPYIPLAALLVISSPRKLLSNPSDALFAALLTFALAQVLSFVQDGQARHLWWASGFLGLSALSRSDGVIVWGFFLALAPLWGLRRRETVGAISKLATASVLPFLGIVGGYLLGHTLAIGEFYPGLDGRSYYAFEQGHVASPGIDGDVRQVYGTPEENHSSILNAIRHNPHAFAVRVRHNLSRLPELALGAYGKRLTIVLLLFALRGAWELLRRKQFWALGILVACPLYLLVYGITFFREGYLIQPYAALLALVAIGAGCLPGDLRHPRMRWLVMSAFAVACLVGLATNKLAIFAGASVFLVAILAASLMLRRFPADMAHWPALIVLLCAGMVVYGGYPSPAFRLLGQNPDEQAVVALGQAFAPDTRVLTALPGPVQAAKMGPVSISPYWREAQTPGEFLTLLTTGERKVLAIYVEPNFYNQEPALWVFVNALDGRGLERIAQFDDGSIQIFRVTGR